MTCPLCGIGVLPGKVCLNCGYDPSRPGVRPTSKPVIPDSPGSDPAASMRDYVPPPVEKKASRPKPKEKVAAAQPRAPFPDTDDILEQIDRLGPTPAQASPSLPPKPAAAANVPPAAPPRPAQVPASAVPPQPAQAVAPPPAAAPRSPMPQPSKLQQASVPVTTQFAFEGQQIVGYAGLVAATVVVRIGGADELLPEGMDMHRLSAGPIGTRLRKAIDLAIADLKTEAIERGGNGVVGARLEVLPAQGPLAIVTLIGTAVILE